MENGDKERSTAAILLVKPRSLMAKAYAIDRQRTPRLVPVLVVANVVVFMVTMFANNCPQNNDGNCSAKFLGRFSFEPTSENPFLGPSSATLEKLGALAWTKIVKENESWRLISCVWLHASVLHLLVNMLSLVLGIVLEWQFGFIRVGLIYLLSGIGGSVFSSIFIRKSTTVGASGAVMGIIGAMFSGLLINCSICSNKLEVLLNLVFLVWFNLSAVNLPEQVNVFAHIGGFLTGFLAGFVFLVRPQSGWSEQRCVKSKYAMHQYVLWILATVLLLVGFTVAWLMMFRGDDGIDKGSWSRRMTVLEMAMATIFRSLIVLL